MLLVSKGTVLIGVRKQSFAIISNHIEQIGKMKNDRDLKMSCTCVLPSTSNEDKMLSRTPHRVRLRVQFNQCHANRKHNDHLGDPKDPIRSPHSQKGNGVKAAEAANREEIRDISGLSAES